MKNGKSKSQCRNRSDHDEQRFFVCSTQIYSIRFVFTFLLSCMVPCPMPCLRSLFFKFNFISCASLPCIVFNQSVVRRPSCVALEFRISRSVHIPYAQSMTNNEIMRHVTWISIQFSRFNTRHARLRQRVVHTDSSLVWTRLGRKIT